MPRTFIRTPQACDACRRRKSKCDGIRPRCRRCSARNVTCIWSSVDNSQDTSTSIREIRTASIEPIIPENDPTPRHTGPEGLKACLELFFSRHFASDFCSFDHRPDFEAKCMSSPLLSSSIIALCGRYLEPSEAQAHFQIEDGPSVSALYLKTARSYAKAASDQPSLSHIQGNLVLAQAELISNSGSRHYLFAGTAIRMAEIMRLNKDFHQKHSLKEQEIRRRTLWACLIFDRALAYFLAKHRTIDLENVGIPVPGTDMSLVYQEETRGVTLDDLLSYRRPSDLGLSSYLIKTICLWSDLADFAVYSRRNLDKFPPTDSRSLLATRYGALHAWTSSLHPSLCWSIPKFQSQCELGMGKSFVAMHFLLRSAGCVAHQCYLPHLAIYTQPCDLADGAGWSYLHREQSLIEICVSNALEIGDMLSHLLDPETGPKHGRDSLQSIWVASSILIAANTFLWLQHARDEFYSTDSTQQKAQSYLNLISQLLTSWLPTWKSAKQWLMAVNVMQALYKAAYLGEIHENILTPGSTHAEDDESTEDFRPQPGDGYPSLISLPHLQASIKFATGDTSARFIDIQSIWLQLSGGWPYGFMAPACFLETVGEGEGGFDLLDGPAREGA